MLVKFRTNLGSQDAKLIKDKTGITLDISQCVTGHPDETVDPVEVPNAAAELLIARKIAEPVKAERNVAAVAKKPELTAPAK